MTLLSVRKPTGKDLVDLFLLCSPEHLLKSLNITSENQSSAAANFDSMDTSDFNAYFGMSLIFAGKSKINKKKSASLIQSLYIDPDTIFWISGYIFSQPPQEAQIEPPKRTPTNQDIIDLFLLCAPNDALEQLGISEENRNDIGKHSSDNFQSIFNLALFYASNSRSNQRKSFQLIQSLYIDPYSLFSFKDIANLDEFEKTEVLIKEIEKKNAKAIRAKGGYEKSKRSHHSKIKENAYSTWNTWKNNPKMFKKKVDFAEHILEKFKDLSIDKDTIIGWCKPWEHEAKLSRGWWKE
ncbi:hypothetical protein HA050_20275 [Iodobacter sp. HSC-16F04]|uniref:Uncharacterized protein n=1 Tax=Iodobacter violaceini TaxID=3044271 RepID=A0ABX0L4Q1_9NEIS|nr:hypothetical protein [Iodobacter violacea]NHQ88441.1 hypothetical protein [Iodobacter violacea]